MLISSSSISEKSKKQTPINDAQDKKVYKLDSLIFMLMKKNEIKIKEEKDFFETALSLFKKEGVEGYRIENNNSQRVSNIDNYNKILTFSNPVITEKNYEVVLHEMAHALCRHRAGYNYLDSHGELFVYFLFNLVKKYTNLNDKELCLLADQVGVSYFTNVVLENKEITENEYKKILEESSFLENNSLGRKSSVFNTMSGYELNSKNFLSLFKNNNSYWVFRRKMFKFEEVLYISSFSNLSKKELSNTFIISPLFNTDISGYKIKSGKHSMFGFLDSELGQKEMLNKLMFDKKSDGSKFRMKKIQEMKSKGYSVLAFTDFNQYLAVQNFFIERLKALE